MNKVWENVVRINQYALKQAETDNESNLPTRAKIYETTTYVNKLFDFAREHETEFNKRFFKD